MRSPGACRLPRRFSLPCRRMGTLLRRRGSRLAALDEEGRGKAAQAGLGVRPVATDDASRLVDALPRGLFTGAVSRSMFQDEPAGIARTAAMVIGVFGDTYVTAP